MTEKFPYHVFSHNNTYILFHPLTYTFYELEQDMFECFKKLEEGISVDQTVQETGITKELLEEILLNLEKELQEITPVKVDGISGIVQRLVINVSQACNLRCKYCYANGGDYDRGGLMDFSTAKNTIDYFLKHFKEIGYVLFFGGEPFLNLPLIEYICQYFIQLKDEKKIEIIPTYGLVTNGTIVTDEVIELVNKYGLNCTISIDGPREINDLLRVTSTGEGTYDKIATGIRKLQSESKFDVDYEITYTGIHKKLGWTPTSTMEYVKENFKFTKGTLSYFAGPKESELAATDLSKEDMHQFYDQVFDSYLTDDPYITEDFIKIMIPFIRKIGVKYLCPVGHQAFSVDAHGSIYPCQMLIGRNEYILGNVACLDLAPKIEFVKEVDKFESVKCQSCWLKYLCEGCVASNILRCEQWVDQVFCDNKKDMYEYFIYKLISYRNSEDWAKFIETIQKTMGKDPVA